MNDRFVVDNSASVDGTYLVGSIHTSYAELVAAFGEPLPGDDYKVSSEWIIRDTISGKTFTIYDWKATDLYEKGLPSVEDFRKSGRTIWHVGGKSNPDQFINWLIGKVYAVN